MTSTPRVRTLALVAAGLLMGFVPPAFAAAEKVFDSPEAAAKALVEAARANDSQALIVIFGESAKEVLQDEDDPGAKARRQKFAQAADELLELETGENDARIVVVGKDRYPFPVPIVKAGEGWRFDTAAGKDEILARIIGENELSAIEALQAYVDAQVAYAAEDRDGDQVKEYAQRLVSTAGQKDGLYWKDDADPSPLGAALPVVKDAAGARDASARPEPFMGYYWKILKAQGSNAPGGAHSYVINGNMIAGFALLATPAEHGRTGIMTFLVSHHGKILQKDLGESCVDASSRIDAFDPDATWKAVEPPAE
jgi:hypothetical protein